MSTHTKHPVQWLKAVGGARRGSTVLATESVTSSSWRLTRVGYHTCLYVDMFTIL